MSWVMGQTGRQQVDCSRVVGQQQQKSDRRQWHAATGGRREDWRLMSAAGLDVSSTDQRRTLADPTSTNYNYLLIIIIRTDYIITRHSVPDLWVTEHLRDGIMKVDLVTDHRPILKHLHITTTACISQSLSSNNARVSLALWLTQHMDNVLSFTDHCPILKHLHITTTSCLSQSLSSSNACVSLALWLTQHMDDALSFTVITNHHCY